VPGGRHLESLEYRKQRLKLNRASVHSDMLNDRRTGVPLKRRHMDAAAREFDAHLEAIRSKRMRR
jgi:hypothetical protein